MSFVGQSGRGCSLSLCYKTTAFFVVLSSFGAVKFTFNRRYSTITDHNRP